MNQLFPRCFLAGLVCLLISCSESDNFAPVMDLNGIQSIPKAEFHRVTPNETLYEKPITPRVASVVKSASEPNYSASVVKSASEPNYSASVVKSVREPNYSASGWVWPAQGKVVNSFSPVNKGINIVSQQGEPIHAVASGKVVYCGNGLRSYGNLIIIKHNSLYLSTYAHNQNVLVRQGMWVKKGQKIAEMGKTGTNKIMLHFEIRRAGKPINPMSLYHTEKS